MIYLTFLALVQFIRMLVITIFIYIHNTNYLNLHIYFLQAINGNLLNISSIALLFLFIAAFN